MIVDSSALVALMLAEPGWERIQAALLGRMAILPAPCYLEICMVMSGRFGTSSVQERIMGLLDRLSIRILPFTSAHAQAAADAFLRYGKGRHPAALNFGDCMAYAAAKVEGLPLLFVGEDFARTDVAVAAPA